MSAPRTVLTVIATAILLLGVAACGGSSDGTGTAVVAPTMTTTAAQGRPAGAGAEVTLTGTWTYSGPLTGHFVCFHNEAGHLELEGQQPYLVDLSIDRLANGTFEVPDYTKLMTGQTTAAADRPKIKVSRLEKVGDSAATSFLTNSGSITINDNGTNGTATWKATSNLDPSDTITAELHWHDCQPSG